MSFDFYHCRNVGYYYKQLEKYFESLRYRNHINGSSYSLNITELTDLKANILPVEASLEYIDKATASIKLLEEVEEWEVLLIILGTTHDSNPSFVQTISAGAPHSLVRAKYSRFSYYKKMCG